MRLFISAQLPASVVDALIAWCPQQDNLRAVAPASLHVTLAFLGERCEAQAAAAAGVVRAVAAPVEGLSLGAARWLPPRRPRVLAVEVHDPCGGLAALQRAVVEGLAGAIGFVPERRRFLPHVTVARVSRRGGGACRAGAACAGRAVRGGGHLAHALAAIGGADARGGVLRAGGTGCVVAVSSQD